MSKYWSFSLSQLTGLHQERVYTGLGTSCPQCVHQIVLLPAHAYQYTIWCIHFGQENAYTVKPPINAPSNKRPSPTPKTPCWCVFSRFWLYLNRKQSDFHSAKSCWKGKMSSFCSQCLQTPMGVYWGFYGMHEQTTIEFGVCIVGRKNLNWCTPFFGVSMCIIKV